MANLTQFTDSAGRTAWKDNNGRVYTEGGKNDTYYNVDQWNQRQSSKYGSGSSSKSSSSNNIQDTIRQAIKMAQDANKPAIQSYEAAIPEVSSKYAQQRTQLQGEQQPLKDRYASLLAEIKGNQGVAENRQTTTTNNELGKRGITNDSGLYQQTLTDAVNPVTQQYTGMIKDTGLAQEADLRDLANKIASTYTNETADTRAIKQLIANLQSGAANTGITLGTNEYNTNVDNNYKNALQSFEQQKYNETTLPQSKAQVNYTNALAGNVGGGSGGMTITDFMKLLNGTSGTTGGSSAPDWFKPLG